MGRFITGLFGGAGKPAAAPATALRAQSSIYGLPIPLLLAGQQRMGSELIWYGGLFSVTESSPGGAGGKGAYFTSSGGGQQQYYYAAIDFALCEGPIAGVQAIWPHTKPRPLGDWENSFSTSQVSVAATVFVGSYTQGKWGYIDAHNPAQSLNNRGIAHVGVVNYPLGPSAQLPNVNWEPYALNAYLSGADGLPDGDPSIAIRDFLTNAHFGVGFPSARLGDLTLYANYCLANGLLVSPALSSQVQAASWLKEFLAATNTLARWSGGVLTLVPYGDDAIFTGQALNASEPHTIASPVAAGIAVNHAATFISDQGVVYTGSGNPLTLVSISKGPARGEYTQRNGVYKFNQNDIGQGVTISYSWAATASYVPQNQVIYDLTLDDFLPNQGSIGSGQAPSNSAVLVVRRDQAQRNTSVTVEFLDRSNRYNPMPAEVRDDASILLYGRPRKANVRQAHFFCLGSAAQYAATQLLIREAIPADYQFTLGRWAVLLDVGDIVTLTVLPQNMFRQGVRITEITENADRSFTFLAEEYTGTAGAPLFGAEAAGGYQPGTDADPGNTIVQLFEPTAELLGGADQAVWAACCGGADWGGCYVWVSTDGGNQYKQVGAIHGPARMGVTTTSLPQVTVNQNGATTDDINPLGVDLAESAGVLLSASAADAQALRTACYLDGEIIAYQTATLTSANKYTLTNLVRGAYGTEASVVAHDAGVPFCRLDGGIFEYPFNQADIGKQIFLKFQSVNTFSDSPQPLADVAAITYTIKGTALASPLPTVANVTSAIVDGRLVMAWDEIGRSDFRTAIFYEIRAGASPASAVVLGLVAHPPFVFPSGTNTYWISGWCQPVPGMIVRSESWSSIAVTNAQVTANIIASFEEKSLTWPGTVSNGGGVDTGINAVRTGGTGNILGEAVLATIVSGSYNSGTGLVTLTLSTASGIGPGDSAIIASATGTGSFASINGTQTAGLGTTGTTLTFTIATGLTMTITGGNYELANTLNQGGQQSCTYDPGQVVDIGRVDTCPVYALTLAAGVQVADNILDINDFLSVQDVLDAASSQFVNVYPEIAISQSAVAAFSAWQKFVPGKFSGQRFKMRWQLITTDPSTIAYLLDASWSVDVPDRIDHPLVNGVVNNTGLAITFAPDSAPGTPAVFNGGPGGAGVPAVVVTWSGSDKATGDYEKVTSLTTAGCTVTIYDASNTAVQRHGVSIYVYGW
jgi:hypothetical protein